MADTNGSNHIILTSSLVILAEHASLFKFGFTRRQREDKPEREKPEDRPSTSTQVQPSATPEGTKRAPSQEQVIGSPKKVKKDGPRFVRVLTLQKWQKQTGDDDPGFKSKRPDLTWIRYESRRKPEIVRQFNEAAGITQDVDAYVNGTYNIKKTNCERHAQSKGHKNAKGMLKVIYFKY